MAGAIPQKNLSILLGALRQETGDGELILDQNDGVRRLFLCQGELIHLRSDVAGEQFGGYLLRQGFLDLESLNQLLASKERDRIGEKVIQGGLMTLEERDDMLQNLQEMIMVHALEHPILNWTWNPGPKDRLLSYDLHFQLDHRHFIWRTFQESKELMDLVRVLEAESTWTWSSRGDLLDVLCDLPLTPGIAYALSFLTSDPISFETFRFLSNLDQEGAGRLIGTLWALGALALSEGELPSFPRERDGDADRPPALDPARKTPHPADMPPCGPRPQAVPAASGDPPPMAIDLDREAGAPAAPAPPPPASWPADLPPTGPRLQPPSPDPAGIQMDRAAARMERPQPVYRPPFEPLTSEQMARKLFAQARQQVSVDRSVEAIRTLEHAVRLQPTGDEAYDVWLMLGQLRMANPAWSTRAITALQNAARIRPLRAEPWATMGEIYHRKGYEPDAVTCYRKARKLDAGVWVPPDVDLNGPTAEDPKPKRGLLGSFRALLGGRK